MSGQTVTLNVSPYLIGPKRGVRTRPYLPKSAIVAMPEATMHKHDLAAGGEDEIRFPWQVTAMKPEAIPLSMQQSTYEHFRPSIPAAYP